MTNYNKEDLKLRILKALDSYLYPVGIMTIISETRIVTSYVQANLNELMEERLVKHGIAFKDRTKYQLTTKGKERLRDLK